MDINYKKSDTNVKITVRGDINSEGGHQLSVKLQEIMSIDDVKDIIFDFSEVNMITSSGIGKLLNFFKYIDSKGGSMRVEGISTMLHNFFKEIHLDKIFPIKT